MEGLSLRPGVTCYAIQSGGRQVGTTQQTITASEEDGRPVWDIIIHQKAGGGAFDLRDHFVVDRSSLLPIRMESRRAKERDEPGWHRVSVSYDNERIRGFKETKRGVITIDLPLGQAVWDGNLWGIAFAALPLKAGQTYLLPYWQYDKGFGSFTVTVVGSEPIDTNEGLVSSWILDAGDRPEAMLRYHIAKNPRQELQYSSESGRQILSDTCR